jgi:site-specific DNA recombinase
MPLRALGAIRLSKVADESTSPARQRERIDWWASGNDADLMGVMSALGVSGAVSPFKREGLGGYLTDARADGWDVLLALKLDRISRSAEDAHKLLRWCTERGKRIVTTDDGIDTATTNGKVFIQLAAVFAEVERGRPTQPTTSAVRGWPH